VHELRDVKTGGAGWRLSAAERKRKKEGGKEMLPSFVVPEQEVDFIYSRVRA